MKQLNTGYKGLKKLILRIAIHGINEFLNT